MTRRDIAAMRLAYECLRDLGPIRRNLHYREGRCDSELQHAIDSLLAGGGVARTIASTLEWLDWPSSRVMRARLALYLRAMLREVPMDRCVSCDHMGGECCRHTCRNGLPLRYSALWEQAKPHRGGT